ncbi:hypothetical protein NWQ33_00910 [Mycoplasmopsis cynos]|nr:hypothetical protein [Mycoplasmopsis cynos]
MQKDNKKKNHNIDITQLEQKINNIVNFTIEIAKKAANKNIDKIKYTNMLQIQKNLIC